MNEPVLCFVRGDWAYFTTQPLEDQWRDDWNDAPYEHNAGCPYEWTEGRGPRYEIVKVAFEGPLAAPCEGTNNSSYSVESINAGAVAWLRTLQTAPLIVIPAGTGLLEFKRRVWRAGGDVYELTPRSDSERSE
jgi:hypothetical protein